MRIIDAHVHQWNLFADPANLRRFLDRNEEVRWLILASSLRGGYYPSPEEVRESNQLRRSNASRTSRTVSRAGAT